MEVEAFPDGEDSRGDDAKLPSKYVQASFQDLAA